MICRSFTRRRPCDSASVSRALVRRLYHTACSTQTSVAWYGDDKLIVCKHFGLRDTTCSNVNLYSRRPWMVAFSSTKCFGCYKTKIDCLYLCNGENSDSRGDPWSVLFSLGDPRSVLFSWDEAEGKLNAPGITSGVIVLTIALKVNVCIIYSIFSYGFSEHDSEFQQRL